MNQAQSNYTPD